MPHTTTKKLQQQKKKKHSTMTSPPPPFPGQNYIVYAYDFSPAHLPSPPLHTHSPFTNSRNQNA